MAPGIGFRRHGGWAVPGAVLDAHAALAGARRNVCLRSLRPRPPHRGKRQRSALASAVASHFGVTGADLLKFQGSGEEDKLQSRVMEDMGLCWMSAQIDRPVPTGGWPRCWRS
jgi:hypothetical protein